MSVPQRLVCVHFFVSVENRNQRRKWTLKRSKAQEGRRREVKTGIVGRQADRRSIQHEGNNYSNKLQK